MRSSSKSCFAKGEDDRGVGVFARTSHSPSDRNLIDAYADGEVEFIGLADARPHDKFGLAVAYAHVSPWAQALDQDFRSLTGNARPARTSERLLTAVYRYEVLEASRCSPAFSTSAIRAAARPVRREQCRAYP